MRCLVVAILLSLTLSGCGGQPSNSRSLNATGPWEWTFSSPVESGDSVTFDLVLVEKSGVVGPEAGALVTVSASNSVTQCTTPPSFTATISSNNRIGGIATSCEGTFKFRGVLGEGESIKGTFTSNGWGAPGGTFDAIQPLGANHSWAGANTFSGQTTFVGPIVATGTNQFSGQNTFSSSGVFSNSQQNDPVQSVVNSCSPGTEYAAEQSNNFATDALAGCVAVPNGATVHQSNGIAGYANSSGTAFAVGGYFSGRCLAANCNVWGSNPIAADGGFAAAQLYGSEVDVNVFNGASFGKGLLFNGAWAAQPSRSHSDMGSMPTVGILQPLAVSGGPFYWTAGIGCAAGATDNGDGTGTGNCIDLGPAAATGAAASQGISFHGRASTNAIVSSKLVQTLDSNNRGQLTWLDESNKAGTFVAVFPVHGTSNYQISGNNFITSGSCTLASGSCSYTFSNPYLTSPNCTANGRSAANAMKVTSTATAVTIASSISTDAQTVSFICMPTAN